MTREARPHQKTVRSAVRSPIGLRGAMLATMIAALWGGTPVAISFTVDELPPLMVAAIRFSLGALFMMIWCLVRGESLRLRRDQFVAVISMGLLLFAQIATFNIGIQRSSSSHATVLINLFVLWVAALEHFVTRQDRMSLRRLIGLVCAASAGFLLMLLRSDQTGGMDHSSVTGDLILVFSSFILGIKILWTQAMLRRVPAGPLIFWHDVIGVMIFLGVSLVLEQSSFSGWKVETCFGLLYQGILVAGLCFAVQAYLLDRHPASQVSVFSCSTPIFGIIAAVLLRADPVSNGLVLAAGFAATGIWLVTQNGSSRNTNKNVREGP